MTKYYLIRGDHVLGTIDSIGDVIALPLFGGGDPMSLLNETHALNLMTNLSLTAAQALAALGLADLRASMLKTVFVAPNPVSIDVSGIAAYHLINIGTYALWQCDGQQDDLLRLHMALWTRAPIQTLGLLAVVQTFGSAFYPNAMRTATGMTTTEALARRNRVATYLESLGFTNTTALRAATTEHTQMLGIATALGFTAAQLWGKMVNTTLAQVQIASTEPSYRTAVETASNPQYGTAPVPAVASDSAAKTPGKAKRNRARRLPAGG